jgi:hypothetical protein
VDTFRRGLHLGLRCAASALVAATVATPGFAEDYTSAFVVRGQPAGNGVTGSGFAEDYTSAFVVRPPRLPPHAGAPPVSPRITPRPSLPTVQAMLGGV